MSAAVAPRRAAVAAVLLYALALIAIALTGGGWLALGRVDPLLAVPGAGWAAVVAVWAMRGQPMWWSLLMAAGGGAILLGTIQVVDGMEGLRQGEWTIATLILLAAAQIVTSVVQVGMRLAGERRWARRLVVLAVLPALAIGWNALAWPMVESAYRIDIVDAQRPRVAVLTALPIGAPAAPVWQVGPAHAGNGEAGDPLAMLLARATRERRLVSVDAAVLADSDVLLLAHPPALDPAQLVAIDSWVRGGGRAVVLADGLSSWPPSWPLGDPRNPPVTSLLGPLLAHWGVELAAPEGLSESHTGLRDSGQRLEMLSAGRFHGRDSQCLLRAQGLIAECRIGRGHALLVADADMLAAPLWAGPGGSASSLDWRSGNMLWLLDKLGGEAGRARALPSWSKRRDALGAGMP